MSRRLPPRWRRLGFAAAAGAGVGSFAFWSAYWFSFVRGNLQGPDFFSFYAAARLYVLKGGSAVYDIALQKQFELQVTGQTADRFIVLPYFHPPYYTLLIAPLAALSYREAYYAMAAFNVLLAIGLVAILVRYSLSVHGRAVIVAAAMIAGFFPLFVTVLQGQSDLVVLVPLAAAYTAWARGRHGWAGVFSALALAKPQLLLLIPVLFLARRAWRALAGDRNRAQPVAAGGGGAGDGRQRAGGLGGQLLLGARKDGEEQRRPGRKGVPPGPRPR